MDNLDEQIYENSTPDQINAISHIGSHARLLAGPGTGKTKTLTRRVFSLILKHNVDPDTILLITFTRKAAAQLKEELKKAMLPHKKNMPHISTLHSFALKQILFNSKHVNVLPKPIRIADDWEERHIIQEDLKMVLELSSIDEVQKLINQLSTDWETLRIDEKGWEEQFPNAAFLGAWRNHKNQYGETLRGELVYQLKRELNLNREFKLDKNYRHILIDEYQDLNACDLAIVSEFAKRNAELFVAGDDDQSIYGFRFATPSGIRNFELYYNNSKKMALEICFRCDKSILHYAEFVANLDSARLPKPTKPRNDAEDGEVIILGFNDQDHEANMIAAKIEKMIEQGCGSGEITILLRSDRYGVMSKPLIGALNAKEIKVFLAGDAELEQNHEFRTVISILRLLSDQNDCLAWRTLMQVGKNGLGSECIKSIGGYAQNKGIRFNLAIEQLMNSPDELKKFGKKIRGFSLEVLDILNELKRLKSSSEIIESTIEKVVSQTETKVSIKSYFTEINKSVEDDKLESIIKAISTSSDKIEQTTKEDAINILTMHQAKGLTFDVCFIVGAEDEFIPGRNTGEKEGDERRLLYVSMTRARHKLYITYCNRRTGPQKYSGSNSGNERRTLTRFLRDSKIPNRQIK